MTVKEQFIQTVEELFKNSPNAIPDEVVNYFEECIKAAPVSKKPGFTQGGLVALSFLQQTYGQRAGFKAKEVAEYIGANSRSVSGWCRKLETDGYVSKIGENPVIYAITEKGLAVNIQEEEEKLAQ